MTAQVVLTVGIGEQFATINAAILAADSMGGNADIKVNGGTYTNDGGYLSDGINNVTIEGVGGMVNIVDPTYSAGGKAAIVTGGQNILLENLDISGVTVADGNGAGVRYDQGSLTLDNVILHGNQNGILGAPDSNGLIVIENSDIYNNGTSAGNTHNIYIGYIAQFTLTSSYIHDANVGHEVKSRAENNTITNNVIADNAGTSSYSIDLPNGGNATITGNVIQQGSNNQNHIINSYGEEGGLHVGTSVTFSDNEIINDDPNGGGPLWQNNGATVTGAGNAAWNLTNLGSGVNPNSVAQLSSAPSLAAAEQTIGDSLAENAATLTGSDPTSSSPSLTATLPVAPGTNSAPSSQKDVPDPSESQALSDQPVGQITSSLVAGDAYRFFSMSDGTEFLSTDHSEIGTILETRPDMIFEGVAFATVTSSSDASRASIFRFFDTQSGTHFYTTSATERDSLVASQSDLVYEGTSFNVDLVKQAGDVPVYRFFDSSNGSHFYTASAAEQQTIGATRPDMIAEGVAFYVPAS